MNSHSGFRMDRWYGKFGAVVVDQAGTRMLQRVMQRSLAGFVDRMFG
ncbi:MAG: hypothetical protein ACYS18_12670 [Planctomycetota bacterium]